MRMAWRHMQQIGAAIVVAQPVTARARIQDQCPCASLIGQGQRLCVIRQHHHELRPRRQHLFQRGAGTFGRDRDGFGHKVLRGKAPGGVIVIRGKHRPGKAQITRRQRQPRYWRQTGGVYPQNCGPDNGLRLSRHRKKGRPKAELRSGCCIICPPGADWAMAGRRASTHS